MARTATTTAASSDTTTGRMTIALKTNAASRPKYSAARPTPTPTMVSASALSRPAALLDRRPSGDGCYRPHPFVAVGGRGRLLIGCCGGSGGVAVAGLRGLEVGRQFGQLRTVGRRDVDGCGRRRAEDVGDPA
jgi:hypothetical protein